MTLSGRIRGVYKEDGLRAKGALVRVNGYSLRGPTECANDQMALTQKPGTAPAEKSPISSPAPSQQYSTGTLTSNSQQVPAEIGSLSS